MTSKSESLTKRLVIAFSFFVLLPFTYQFLTGLLGKGTNSEPKKQPTVQVSPTPTQIDCFDIRAERNSLENVKEKNREEVLREINALQKAFLLNKLEELSNRGLVTAYELRQIKDISEGTLQERADSFVENFLDVSATLDRLIKNKHLRPYFEKEVVVLGERLASSSNPTFALILANRICFDELDIMMAENLTSIDLASIESGWGKKKNGADFASVLSKG